MTDHNQRITLFRGRYQKDRKKLKWARDQVVVLNNKISDLGVRLMRAKGESNPTFRYTLSLQLVTVESLRNMYYEYVCQKRTDLKATSERIIEEQLLQAEDMFQSL